MIDNVYVQWAALFVIMGLMAVGAYTDATHGMTLASVSLPYYRHIMSYGLQKFRRFATQVWGISTENKSDSCTPKAVNFVRLISK